MNDVLKTIQLDGRTWQNQVDSIRNTVPPKVIRHFCQGNIYDRLKTRPYGHIILAKDGIIIDELFVIRYEADIVLRVDLIDSTMQTGNILRVFLATRINLKGEVDKGKHIVYEVYL